MAYRQTVRRLASNNTARFRDVPLVEAVEGEFAQLMALFAAWRADIDSEPFRYSDADLFRSWVPPAGSRRDRPEPPAPSCPHWT